MAASKTAVDPAVVAALAAALGIELPESDDSDDAPTRKGKRGGKTNATKTAARKTKTANEPDAKRRKGTPTGRQLWALNQAGYLRISDAKGKPLTFGACWDAHPSNAS